MFRKYIQLLTVPNCDHTVLVMMMMMMVVIQWVLSGQFLGLVGFS